MDDEYIHTKATRLRQRIMSASQKLQDLQRACTHSKPRMIGWKMNWETERGIIQMACTTCGSQLNDISMGNVKNPFPEFKDVVRSIAMNTGKIDAIKVYRILSGSTLLEAKNAVEEIIGFPQFT